MNPAAFPPLFFPLNLNQSLNQQRLPRLCLKFPFSLAPKAYFPRTPDVRTSLQKHRRRPLACPLTSSPPTMATNPLSFKEAAKVVLKEAAEPLTPKEITIRAIEKGLLQTEGSTPEATMGAQLYVDVKRNPKTIFRNVGNGKFVLRSEQDTSDSAELMIAKQNELVRIAIRKRLLEMDPFQFEFLVGDLLKSLGYVNVQVTKRSGDKGIDVLADLTLEGITNVKTVVQVKRFKDGNNISGAIVAQLRGSAEVDQRGLVITTSDFSKDALIEAKAQNKMPVALEPVMNLVERVS